MVSVSFYFSSSSSPSIVPGRMRTARRLSSRLVLQGRAPRLLLCFGCACTLETRVRRRCVIEDGKLARGAGGSLPFSLCRRNCRTTASVPSLAWMVMTIPFVAGGGLRHLAWHFVIRSIWPYVVVFVACATLDYLYDFGPPVGIITCFRHAFILGMFVRVPAASVERLGVRFRFVKRFCNQFRVDPSQH